MTMSIALVCLPLVAAEPEILGEWSIRVGGETFTIAPAAARSVRGEKYDRLPLYNLKEAGWKRGARLRGVATQETTARHMLVPGSVTMRSLEGAELRRGTDYEVDDEWGTFGRLEGGGLTGKEVVVLDYDLGLCRLDAIFLKPDGKHRLAVGQPHLNVPRPPEPAAGEVRVANVWVPGRTARLTQWNLFPVLAAEYPEPPRADPPAAAVLVPKTWAKLKAGETVRLLAWGDSVTDGGFVGDRKLRWQEQFATALRGRFPQATIELIHLGWGGRSTASFLAEPPGSPWNYQEKVLGCGADLVVSEFVNDAGLRDQALVDRYGKFRDDFRAAGLEWIILTPHYVRPDWMGLPGERDCDADPRPYVQGLRRFATDNHLALADASLRWGHLWREGIPYTTLLLNAINHPDARGMKLFADALMTLF